jgi:hypothetical protein
MVGGVEVLRGLTYPVRNPDWGTHLTTVVSETGDEVSFTRDFAEKAGAFTGVFRVCVNEKQIVAEVELRFPVAMQVNRAGFTLLHPIRGVAGEAMTLRHPDGRETATRFPALISPAQPARDIAGLRHVVQGVVVDIAMEGDVFEMEDQRNWSDASFKTYCRPLALPFPYSVAAGEVIRQKVTLDLFVEGDGTEVTAAAASATARMPDAFMAHEAGISDAAALADFPGLPVQLRLDRETPEADVHVVSGRAVALEIVFDDLADLQVQIARSVGVRPLRVVALPRPFLKSYQPDGAWPDGVQPQEALEHLRAGFSGVAVGGGSLTNFTELNRCRPDPEKVDFVTFGNTAIVHAADDLSVRQTLEAVPDILASARAIADGKPLHLGLMSIGMRCNPYGVQVAENPDLLRLPMAMADPRQTTDFAAVYAVALLAAAARAGVSSLALAMPGGPLGAVGPLAAVVRQAHLMAGRTVTVTEESGRIHLDAGDMALFANLSDQPWAPPGLAPIPPDSAACWPA